jgi:hypothetical protein
VIRKKVTGLRGLVVASALGGSAILAVVGCASSSTPNTGSSTSAPTAAASEFHSFQSQAGVKQGETAVESQAKTCAKAESGSFSLVTFGQCMHKYYAKLTAKGAYTCGKKVFTSHNWHLSSFRKADPNHVANREAFAVAFADTCAIGVNPTQTLAPTPTTSGGAA